ncbi:MAG: bifunctional transaldolase/phosoglucose isomerase [Acidobacteriales bacterium]|nr:bifunctional transaldolase/phosoglucose isomerase [Terriglobales bacterium]
MKYNLSGDIADSVKAHLADWRAQKKVKRLWSGDASLWTGNDEAEWLGWLNVTESQIADLRKFHELALEARREAFSDILLLGMGGSSLCPEVLQNTFGQVAEFPQLHVLDSTDPAQIKTIESKINIAKTLFVVSSKSGTTLEPNIYKQYFFESAAEVVGKDKAGAHFIAITDPGSSLQKIAEADHFRNIFFGVPSIGGRYSALSDFGMVPAALMGLDVDTLLQRAQAMVEACRNRKPEQNPGAMLGIVLGAAATTGRDKVTIIASPGIFYLGAWLEQLLAESTGKVGKGIIPVDREPAGPPEVYGDDRIFVYLRLEAASDQNQDATVAALESAGHPVVHIPVQEIYCLGEEFFRWEIATAVAGSIIGINAFNQPDVEASKIATRKLTSEYEEKGSLPEERPIFERDGIKLFTDQKNAGELNAAVGNQASLSRYLASHLSRLRAGDYFALLAYIEMNAVHEARLQQIRQLVLDHKHVATCLGFGPRFLHSTGQAYKGGPNSGVFLQLTCDDAVDLPVPGQKYTFGVVKAAQARGDFQVLVDRGRRALRIHLGSDLDSSLDKLLAACREGLTTL